MKDIQNKLINTVTNILTKYPNLRLGETLCRVLNYSSLYYIPDEQLLDVLSKYYDVTANIETKPKEEIKIEKLKPEIKVVEEPVKKPSKAYVNKDGVIKAIPPETIDQYLTDGWKLGRK